MPKVKDEAYVINLDENKSIGTHGIALHVNAENVTYCDSLGVAHISKEINKFRGNKNIIANIYTSKQCDNVWIPLYWIYCFYAKR